MEAKKLNYLSIQEYLSIESESDKKYEFHDGFIVSMAGGSLNHGFICGNIFAELRSALKAKNSDCKVFNSEIKLHIKSQNRFLYPDAMVICGEIQQSEEEIEALTNPKVIVEVLSKSTAHYDRGDKFYFYRQIESLEAYILIEQEKALIEIYQRKGQFWQITRVEGLEETLFIPSLNLNLKLAEIYQDVEF